ncbi:unnamed protein product [Amoebophrya sp. A120]|nr:unnamed protein product [Amoebophrya sp. A120]|eukprot:GSA120T00010999001.1
MVPQNSSSAQLKISGDGKEIHAKAVPGAEPDDGAKPLFKTAGVSISAPVGGTTPEHQVGSPATTASTCFPSPIGGSPATSPSTALPSPCCSPSTVARGTPGAAAVDLHEGLDALHLPAAANDFSDDAPFSFSQGEGNIEDDPSNNTDVTFGLRLSSEPPHVFLPSHHRRAAQERAAALAAATRHEGKNPAPARAATAQSVFESCAGTSYDSADSGASGSCRISTSAAAAVLPDVLPTTSCAQPPCRDVVTSASGLATSVQKKSDEDRGSTTCKTHQEPQQQTPSGGDHDLPAGLMSLRLSEDSCSQEGCEVHVDWVSEAEYYCGPWRNVVVVDEKRNESVLEVGGCIEDMVEVFTPPPGPRPAQSTANLKSAKNYTQSITTADHVGCDNHVPNRWFRRQTLCPVPRVTPLYVAVEGGHLEVVKVLLDAHVKHKNEQAERQEDTGDMIMLENQDDWEEESFLEVTDSFGRTALYRAAEQNSAELVRLLIAAGADPDHPNHELQSALEVAGEAGNVEVVRLLVHEGETFQCTLEFADQSLHLFSQTEHKFRVLVSEQPADAELLDATIDFCYVCQKEMPECARFLQEERWPLVDVL